MASHKHESIIRLKDKTLFEFIEKELIIHGEVMIRGFGVFKLKRISENVRWIPGAKKVGKVDSHVRIKFLPTKSLKVNMQKYHGK